MIAAEDGNQSQETCPDVTQLFFERPRKGVQAAVEFFPKEDPVATCRFREAGRWRDFDF